MADPGRHLHAVDPYTGEVIAGGCPDCKALELELRTKRGQITRLKNELAHAMAVEPDHDDVLEVMEFWRSRVAPKACVSSKMKGWITVRNLLRLPDEKKPKLPFTPLRLKAAVVGMALDEYHMDPQHRHRRYLENAFNEVGRVCRFIEDAVDFKTRTTGSALTILEELGLPAFEFLADRCSCGEIRLAHMMGQGCDTFDEFTAKVDRFMADAL